MLEFHASIFGVAVEHCPDLIALELGMFVVRIDKSHLELLESTYWISASEFHFCALRFHINGDRRLFLLMLFSLMLLILVLIPVSMLMGAAGNAVFRLVFVIRRAQAPLLAYPAAADRTPLVFQEAVFEHA